MQCSSSSYQLSGSSQHFQRVLTLYAYYMCVPTVRDVWVSDLSDRKCHEEVKMGSRQRTGLGIFLGCLIRACRVHWIFSGASYPALSVTAETAETFVVTPGAFPEHLGRTERARWLVK